MVGALFELSSDPNWTDILTALSSVGVLIAALFALGAVSEARKSRHAMCAAEFSRRWDEPDLVETRQLIRQYDTPEDLRVAYFTACDDKTTDLSVRLMREPDYFEDLALLQDLGAIDYEFVCRSLGDLIVRRWRTWQPTIDEIRDHNGGLDNYPAFRALATRVRDDPNRH